MDRPVSQRDQWLKRLRPMAAVLVGVVAILVLGQVARRLMRPSLDRAKLAIARVERGPVTAAIETSGVLVPQRETSVTAPAETRVLRILKKPGAPVARGEAILALDTTELELELETLRQQLALKENARRQERLRFEKRDGELAGEIELAALDLRYLEARLGEQRRLFAKGLSRREALEQASLLYEKKKLEQRRLDQARIDARAAHTASGEGLLLEIALLRKSRARTQARLDRATTGAPVSGVLTWVVEEEGSTIRSGEPLARIADLSHFRCRASLSDFYADRVFIDQTVRVRTGDRDLPGTIARLLPEVKDGVMAFEIAFDQPDDLGLRSNQRVEVFLETGGRDDVRRIKRGPALPGTGTHRVFVIGTDRAEAREVRIGLTGMGFAEVLSGLEVGESVILESPRAFENTQVIYLR